MMKKECHTIKSSGCPHPPILPAGVAFYPLFQSRPIAVATLCKECHVMCGPLFDIWHFSQTLDGVKFMEDHR